MRSSPTASELAATVSAAALALLVALAAAPALAQRTVRPPPRFVLALDSSASMAHADPELHRRVAAKLLVDLLGPDGTLSILGFGETASPAVTLVAAERNRLRAAIDALPASGAAAGWSAGLEAALATLPAERPSPGARPVVVLLTASTQASPHSAAELDRLVAAAQRSGALLFVIGVGPALEGSGGTTTRAELERVAAATAGGYLACPAPAGLVREMLAVVGARAGFVPGEPRPLTEDPIELEVLPSTRRLSVVAPTADARLRLALVRRDGASTTPWPFGRDDDAFRREGYVEPARGHRGYALLQVTRPAAGTYLLSRAGGGAAVGAWVIAERGLRLMLQGAPAWLPPGTPRAFGAVLRADDGRVVELDADTRREIELTFVVGPNRSDGALLDRLGFAQADIDALPAGRHEIVVSLRHRRGLLQVEPARGRTEAVWLSALAIRPGSLTFDETATEPFERSLHIEIAPTRALDDIELRLDASQVSQADNLEVLPRRVSIRPRDTGLDVRLRVRDPARCRRRGCDFVGAIRMLPAAPERLRGLREWRIAVRGRLRPWAPADWARAYAPHGAGALGSLALLVLLVVVARRRRRRL